MNNRTSQWLGHDIRRLTPGNVLAERVRESPDALFLHDLDEDRSFSYADADRETRRMMNALAAAGIRRGTHVAVMMGTRPENVWVQFALAQMGAVTALVNTSAIGLLLRHYLQLAEVTHVVADDHLLPQLVQACEDLEGVTSLMICTSADLVPSRMRPGLTVRRLDDLTSGNNATEWMEEQAPRFDDAALILFTSGTTGPSKGVVYTHAKSMLYALDTMLSFGVRSNDRILCWMPLFHLSGWQSGVLTALVTGCSIAMTGRFSASRVLEQARDSGSTVLMLPGASLNMLWAQAPSPTDRDHRVRICSTVPIPAFASAFEARFGFRLTSAYGLTDCGMPTVFGLSDPQSKLGSAGRSRDGWVVRVVDDADFDLPPGETGEIVIRCERPWGAATGYYRDPQSTMEAWRNGWFHTGDTGYLDEDGYLWYVGRRKDAIRRRGENISAYEVEEGLLAHPAVAEVAAFPVPSEFSEEEVAVAIILREGASATEADLIAFCVTRMPGYMVPRFVWILDDLPRTLSQKVQKFKLVELCVGKIDEIWDREQHRQPT